MKRIAMLSLHACPLAQQEGKEVGGLNIYVFELAKQLVKKGVLIDIFTYLHDENLQELITPEPNLRVIHIPISKTNIPKKELTGYIPAFVENFFAFIEKQQITYDLYDSHYYLSGLAGLAIQNILSHNTPLIITFHTLGLLKNLVARTDEEKENRDRIDAEFLLVKQANKVIAGSESEKAYLEYLYQCPEQKIEIIYPGVDINIFKPIEKHTAKKTLTIPEDKKIILFVGRIEPVKGIETLLYALKILLTKYERHDAQLFILGKASTYQNELQILCSHLELTGHVQFINQKSSQELSSYYTASEILVQPSLYERFGMAGLEAMSCGIPVITTDATGISDILRSYSALITSVNNPVLLAEKIEYLLVNKALYKELREKVRKEAENLTWENTTEKIIKVYQILLNHFQHQLKSQS